MFGFQFILKIFFLFAYYHLSYWSVLLNIFYVILLELSHKEMCNCPERKMVFQFPGCIFHFPAGIQHPEISQIQGRAYPEESRDGYCWFVIRADRSRLSRVLVKRM